MLKEKYARHKVCSSCMVASTYDYSPPRETEQEDGKDEGSLGCTARFKEVFKQIEKQTSRKQETALELVLLGNEVKDCSETAKSNPKKLHREFVILNFLCFY